MVFFYHFNSCYIGFQCLCNNFSSVIHATILNDVIKKARIAEESYNQMIEKIRPLIKKYAKELKGLNDAIEVTRMNIEK